MSTTPIALASINTLLQIGDGASPETFETVANVSSINGFSMSGMVVDVTSHSTGEPWRQKIVTLLDAGEIAFDLFFIPAAANHRLLLQTFFDRTAVSWRLVFPDPDTTTWEASGSISKFDNKAPVDGVDTAAIVISLTGVPNIPTDGA